MSHTHNGVAHLMAKYMGRMANRGKVWTLIMIVMKAIYRRTLMKPGERTIDTPHNRYMTMDIIIFL